MKKFFLLSLALAGSVGYAQHTITVDKDWSKKSTHILNSSEAEFIIRWGDIDNLGFGWPEGFDPFCGLMTEAHSFPWTADSSELEGFDRILLSSKYHPDVAAGCDFKDGYSASYDAVLTKPVTYVLDISPLLEATITNAFIQFFIDDFQAPSLCSKFQITINGKRFTEAEKIFNAIDQTGPVGKLVTIPLPEEFYPDLNANRINIKIDEALGTGDGFALDFMRIIVNRKENNSCKGKIQGQVADAETQLPVANATVYLSDKTSVIADENGHFEFPSRPSGLEMVSAYATGYQEGHFAADVATGDQVFPFTIFLTKSVSATFGDQQISAGESVTLSNILFDQGKSDLRAESKTELDKVAVFLKEHPAAEIELSGHTSAEGDAALNRSLSYKRVKSCKEYLVKSGIDGGRITAVGFGPDKPVAKNDTEENRAKNRRVEMRVVKL